MSGPLLGKRIQLSLAVADIEQKIKDLNIGLIRAKNALIALDDSCKHKWGETVSADIRHDAYTIPGDPKGTMGIDRRLSTYVSAKTDKRWKRACEKCGKVEHTTRTSDQVTKIPKF